MEKKNFPQRPPRLKYVSQYVRPFYFVTFNTYNKKSILANDEVHNTFITFCHRASEVNIGVGRYVIMPDHIHLFVATPIYGVKLPDWIKALKTVLGKVLVKNKVDRPYWQEGFFDHLMRNDESYAEKWSYVRNNPVRAGLCEMPEAWEFQGEIMKIMYA